jgi:carbon-monoxide dehydrogenase medium subunit
VKPAPFEYAAPTSIEDAVALLAEHRDLRPKVLAGGQTLVPQMNFRQVKPGFLLDLQHVDGLADITVLGDDLVVGAMVRQQVAHRAPEVLEVAPLLSQAIAWVSQTPVRNSGTVGGSVAYGDPGSEIPAASLALDAVMTVWGPDGGRDVPAADFFRGPFETAVGESEILTSIRYPRATGAQAFVEFRRTHLSHAVVGVGTELEVGTDGIVQRARIALCGVGRTPVRATPTEQALVGVAPDEASIDAAVEATVAGLSPASTLHAQSETRVDIARTYLRRGIEQALETAKTGVR